MVRCFPIFECGPTFLKRDLPGTDQTTHFCFKAIFASCDWPELQHEIGRMVDVAGLTSGAKWDLVIEFHGRSIDPGLALRFEQALLDHRRDVIRWPHRCGVAGNTDRRGDRLLRDLRVIGAPGVRGRIGAEHHRGAEIGLPGRQLIGADGFGQQRNSDQDGEDEIHLPQFATHFSAEVPAMAPIGMVADAHP